ncbi:MAG: class I SAM-dependent methyltransferase [Desulfobacteraceae bacterium]|nr:class I SAM-dependent methyltransferase [Desulfobacteraceae bacterium]
MDIKKLDWDELWKEAKLKEKRRKGPEFWDRRAQSFSKHASEGAYTETFLSILNPEPSWTVLDVGSGAGTLAVPLAGKVRAITAIDFSAAMLELLQEKCKNHGIENIRTFKAAWEDSWEALGIEPHDVAIASRSANVYDLKGAILKLDRFAKKRAYISAPVGDGPFNRRLHEAMGMKLPSRPDYIYVYNLLYQLGIFADVQLITLRGKRSYDSHEDAFNATKWIFDRMDGQDGQRLRQYLKDHLVPEGGRFYMSYERVIRWAVISWKKE